MIESGNRNMDRVLGMIQSREGSVILPLSLYAHGLEETYHVSAHIRWNSKHVNVVCISDTGEQPKHYLSDFRLTAEQAPRGPRWKIVHREVDKRFVVDGTDKSLAEDTVQILISVVRKLNRHYQYPSEIYIESSRPSLIRFFEKMKFTPHTDSQKELFDMYFQEYRSRPREDFLHVERDTGSRFLLVRESSRKDWVLVDKHHPQYDPSLYGVQERFVHVAKPPLGRAFNKEPYVIRVTLTYEA